MHGSQYDFVYGLVSFYFHGPFLQVKRCLQTDDETDAVSEI